MWKSISHIGQFNTNSDINAAKKKSKPTIPMHGYDGYISDTYKFLAAPTPGYA